MNLSLLDPKLIMIAAAAIVIIAVLASDNFAGADHGCRTKPGPDRGWNA